jgi:CDP-glycerol glycerophosphotransferase (TagB/SpsB family)
MFKLPMMSALLRKLFQLAYRSCPRCNHAVLWGWPDGEDSVIALEQALQSTRVRRVVMLMSDPSAPLSWQPGRKTRQVKKNSLAGVMWFCLARYVFFTHPCFTRKFPPDVFSVNVWHGMPIKKIGLMIQNDPPILSRHALATSPFWADIMQRAMTPIGGVLPLGLPRNDRLFPDRGMVLGKLCVPASGKLIVWLPTYRKSVRGLPRTDGVKAANVFEMPDVDPDELNAFLAARNAVLLVKPHPMAAYDATGSRSHLRIVDDGWLRDRSLSLYECLGAADLLISDFSSVVIDYLLLDRPVIHAFSDLGEYQCSRGFMVEPIADYFAGPVVTNAREWMDAVDAVWSGDDPEADRRRRLLELSHTHRDAGATRRLLEAAGL